MTKVSYLVKVNGKKGAIKVNTYADALIKAEQLGGFIVRKYTPCDEESTKTENDIKRIKHLENGGQPPKVHY